MKPCLVFILSLLVFCASFQNSLFLVDYQVNREFYETHCVNRDVPDMECHGKCQLKKNADEATSLANVVKYAFEFNLMPTASFALEIPAQPADSDHYLNPDHLSTSYADVITGIVVPPPRI